MKKFSQSVFLSDFNFIVVNYVIVHVAKFNIICERRTPHISVVSMGTPILFSSFLQSIFIQFHIGKVLQKS